MRSRDRALVCALLVAATLAIYAQAGGYPLVDFDDLSYITDNPHVSGGLTSQNIGWAFTHAYDGYWIPLTWLSYMADTSLFDGRSGAYHLTNVGIHAATSCLVFLVFLRMTDRPWRSAAVAAIFAVHPLHVESVAWVAERKDVLSGFFWFLAIWTYVRYVERPSWTRYAWVTLPFASGLMAKPIVVTLPVVLLLLDVWPLARTTARPSMKQPDRSRKARRKRQPVLEPTVSRPGWPLLKEKAPLLALALAASLITIVTQRAAGAVATTDVTPIVTRAANAVVSPAIYLVQMIWPSGLAAIYPYPGSAPFAPAALAALALAGLSIVAWRTRRRAPHLIVGWGWYLVTLLPVLGLIQAGPQPRADRYTYLSMTGIAIMVVWTVARLVEKRPALVRAVAAPVCLLLSLYAALAWRQVQYWRDGETLFRRALSVTTGNYVAFTALGAVLKTEGRVEESIVAYGEALRWAPHFPPALAGLGHVLLDTGRADQAAVALGEAVRLAPSDAISHSNLGSALAQVGRTDEAAAAYRESIRRRPAHAAAHLGLGLVLGRQGHVDDAVREMNEAIRLDPALVEAHINLGIVLAQNGRFAEAIPHFREATRLSPASADAHMQLGNALAIEEQMDEAIAELTTASRLNPSDADLHSNLGIALASKGRFDEALAEITEAIRLDPDRQELRSNLAYVQARRQGAGR